MMLDGSQCGNSRFEGQSYGLAFEFVWKMSVHWRSIRKRMGLLSVKFRRRCSGVLLTTTNSITASDIGAAIWVHVTRRQIKCIFIVVKRGGMFAQAIWILNKNIRLNFVVDNWHAVSPLEGIWIYLIFLVNFCTCFGSRWAARWDKRSFSVEINSD